MPDTPISDLDLARQTMIASGTRVRVTAEIDAHAAALLMQRGLAELNDEFEAFAPEDAQKCLKVTQYGFDLMLGRIAP